VLNARQRDGMIHVSVVVPKARTQAVSVVLGSRSRCSKHCSTAAQAFSSYPL
jgi:hypothetical protein